MRTNISDKFETGNKVTHKLYGAGTILKMEGLGDNAKITIINISLINNQK